MFFFNNVFNFSNTKKRKMNSADESKLQCYRPIFLMGLLGRQCQLISPEINFFKAYIISISFTDLSRRDHKKVWV